MKLKFKKQDFQDDAVDTVAGLFKGQEKANMTFSVADNSAQFNLLQNEFGFGNSLLIDGRRFKTIFMPCRKLILCLQTDFPEDKAFAVSVEMETGTGKTFVYTKTILEMNKRYGFYQIYHCRAQRCDSRGCLQIFPSDRRLFQKSI